ncbi:hypothetical protein F5887DRAFT_649899 [Amanita rubescens]|nr:hypothetical protein F5887DRAFT_649899 [Amanita rubescens]
MAAHTHQNTDHGLSSILASAQCSPPGHPEAHEIWSKIPPLTDILITHGRRGQARMLRTALCIMARPSKVACVRAQSSRWQGCKWDRAQMVYKNICAGRTGCRLEPGEVEGCEQMMELKGELHAIWICISIPVAGDRIAERGMEEIVNLVRGRGV